MRRLLLTVALATGLAAPAFGQQALKLDFHDGLVTVDATNVPVRTIITEWGKIGGTKIVGAERITGAPLTLKLVNVPEAKALETILRSVAGYMAAPRSIAAAGPSRYDRILVMATTSTPPPPANVNRAQPGPNAAMNGTQRFVPRPPQRNEQPEQVEQDEQAEPDENPPNPPVFTFPQNGQNGQAPFVNGVAQPGQMIQPPQNVITISPAINPNGPARSGESGVTYVPPSSAMPAGVARPGMMVQPPPQPNQPGNVRPPGGNQRQ
jgi:hypothetical protein